MRIRRRTSALVMAGALTLAACSTSGDEAAPTTTDAQSPTTTSSEAPTTTEAPEAPTRFAIEIRNVSDGFVAREVGAFTTPVGAAEPAPAVPGEAYRWEFDAAPGERLSFATMFVQSNDWFFATPADGVPLFDEAGTAITGDITSMLSLWDAGTEVDQVPGEGADQAPRQAGPDSGADDPDPTVRKVADRAVGDYVAVTLANEGSRFALTITNTSEDASMPTPIAPGIGVVHGGGEPLFTDGDVDRGEGLEAIAEDGDPSGLVTSIEANAGVTTPLAPGVVTVVDMGQTIFTPGSPDEGLGLEGLAEDGDAAPFAEATAGTVFAIPSGSSEPGPLFPGQSYTAEVTALPGQYLSLATMFVQSNDWFFSLGAEGIPLFDEAGNPITGNITGHTTLWDAGTELDQIPGVGADQAPRQSGPNTGPDDADPTVRLVDLDTGGYITVTITPMP